MKKVRLARHNNETRHRKHSDETIGLVKTLYPITSNADVADATGLTESQVCGIAAQYNLKKRKRDATLEIYMPPYRIELWRDGKRINYLPIPAAVSQQDLRTTIEILKEHEMAHLMDTYEIHLIVPSKANTKKPNNPTIKDI